MYPSRIEPKTSWKHTEVLAIKRIQQFINNDEIFYEIQILTYIFLCKTYSNATSEKMTWKFIQ
jgi:hypothetical protein